MKYVFSFIWAAICAWIIVWLLHYVGVRFNLLHYISGGLEFIHGFGVSAKGVLFVILTFLLLGTGWHKYIGRGLCILLGISLDLIVIGLIIILGYFFLKFMIGLF